MKTWWKWTLILKPILPNININRARQTIPHEETPVPLFVTPAIEGRILIVPWTSQTMWPGLLKKTEGPVWRTLWRDGPMTLLLVIPVLIAIGGEDGPVNTRAVSSVMWRACQTQWPITVKIAYYCYTAKGIEPDPIAMGERPVTRYNWQPPQWPDDWNLDIMKMTVTDYLLLPQYLITQFNDTDDRFNADSVDRTFIIHDPSYPLRTPLDDGWYWLLLWSPLTFRHYCWFHLIWFLLTDPVTIVFVLLQLLFG